MTAGTIVDSTGSYAVAYAIAAVLCLAAGALTFVTKPPAGRAEPDSLSLGIEKAA